MNKLIKALSLVALLCVTLQAQAETAADTESRTNSENNGQVNRMNKPSVLTIAINRPAPATLGLNYSYTVSPLLKATMGYGDIVTLGGKASALGAGVELMYPEWNFTPAVGLHVSQVELSGGLTSINGVTKSGAHLYSSLGMEFQSKGGFNIGFGTNIPFGDMDSTIYISAGWGFDWLRM